MRVNLRDIAAASAHDPKKALLDVLGDAADGFEVFHNHVLVATYIEPEKTSGGIIKPDRSILENRFQGKAALVLKIGPRAFIDQPPYALFGGITISPGDWIIMRPSDQSIEMFMGPAGGAGGVCVRLVEDALIKARVSDPTVVY